MKKIREKIIFMGTPSLLTGNYLEASALATDY
jgi:hypothetical protein